MRFDDPDMLPSDFFRRNVFASFQQDPNALRLLDVLGEGTPTWGSDYPHTESTFPRSREIVGQLRRRTAAPTPRRRSRPRTARGSTDSTSRRLTLP